MVHLKKKKKRVYSTLFFIHMNTLVKFVELGFMFYICNSAKKEKGRRKKVNSLLNLTCKNRNFHKDLFHM